MKIAAFLFFLLCTVSLDALPPVAKIMKGSKEYAHVRALILAPQAPRLGEKRFIDEILPGLFIANQRGAEMAGKASSVTHILSVIDKPKKVRGNGVVWLGIALLDRPDSSILRILEKAYLFIEGATNGAALIHCRAGVSRSAAVVIAYLMRKFDVSYDEAYRFVKSKRPHIAPNPGFEAQLRYYDSFIRSQR